MKILTAAERLVVAADCDNPLALARKLSDTNIVFKENVGLREAGYDTRISRIQIEGLYYFADLKLNDIENTMRRDGKKLKACKPEILTVMCNAPMKALKGIKEELPETEILGVTVLTDIDEDECMEMYGRNIEDQVSYFSEKAVKAGLDGIVCAPHENEIVRKVAGNMLTINNPNVRPAFLSVKKDDQNKKRSRGIKEAFELGATRVIIGRPILEAEDLIMAVRLIIQEISEIRFEAIADRVLHP